MSFGWSAGDIAAALTLLYNIIEALDDSAGSPADYREAVAFLRTLKRTLEPLETLSAFSVYPLHGLDITEEVAYIKVPVEEFLAKVVKYEPSFAAKAAKGRHRHIFRKVQWYVFMRKEVAVLRTKIGSHIGVLDVLLQRFILDVTLKTEEKLPENLKNAFSETMKPELLELLRENLIPLETNLHTSQQQQEVFHNSMAERLSKHQNTLIVGLSKHHEIMSAKFAEHSTELSADITSKIAPLRGDILATQNLGKSHYIAISSRLTEHYSGLAADMEEMREQISSTYVLQQRIESCLRAPTSPGRRKPALVGKFEGSTGDEFDTPIPQVCNSRGRTGTNSGRTQKRAGYSANAASMEVQSDIENVIDSNESLQDLYYLVLVYLGHFLKNLFLVLSRLVQPPRALLPVLLAKYNISFLDAIGRPPRVLPYEYFKSFRVLRAFILEEFKTLPGSNWVINGRYQLMTELENRFLASHNWSSSVSPGTTIIMSMVVRTPITGSRNSEVYKCPESRCPGTWEKSNNPSWATCPVCKKLVFTSTFFRERHSNVLEDEQQDEYRELMNNSGSSDSSDSEPDSIRQSSQEIKPEKANSSTGTSFLTSEDDISIFKRVLQEIPNNSISDTAANFAHQNARSKSAFAKSLGLSEEAMQKRLAEIDSSLGDLKGEIEHIKLQNTVGYVELIAMNEKIGNFNMEIGELEANEPPGFEEKLEKLAAERETQRNQRDQTKRGQEDRSSKLRAKESKIEKLETEKVDVMVQLYDVEELNCYLRWGHFRYGPWSGYASGSSVL